MTTEDRHKIRGHICAATYLEYVDRRRLSSDGGAPANPWVTLPSARTCSVGSVSPLWGPSTRSTGRLLSPVWPPAPFSGTGSLDGSGQKSQKPRSQSPVRC